MISANAVRHRSSNHSPNISPKPPATFVAGKADGADDVGNSAGAAPNDSKLHGRSSRIRRDDLLRSSRRLLVIGGAMLMAALCLLGMWSTSSSVHSGRAARRIDMHRDPPPARHGRKRIGFGFGRKKTREGGGGLRDGEERLPAQKMDGWTARGREWRDFPGPADLDDRKRPDPAAVGAAGEDVPRLTLENPLGDGAEWVEEDSRHYRHYKALKSVDEDRANDEDRRMSSDEEAMVPEPLPLGRAVDMRSWGHEIRPRVLRLHFDKISRDDRDESEGGRGHHGKRKRKEGRGSGDSDARDEGDEKLDHASVVMSGVSRLPTHESEDLPSSDRHVDPYPDDDSYFSGLENVKKSKKYARNGREPLEDEECKPKHEWQTGAFPNCNILHEYELGQLSGVFGRALRKKLRRVEGDGDELAKYHAHGYWRDVWLLSKASGSFAEDGSSRPRHNSRKKQYEEEIVVLKTLRYKHDFTDRNYDRHRKDSLASERLSRSPYVVDIFAYCSNSGVFEYGAKGDIEGMLWNYDEEEEKYYVADIPSLDKLDMAYQVSSGIADMHDVESDGLASIAHTDITPSQFIFINGRWKMNDFNRCRFMRIRKEDGSPCGFHVGANPGKFRAPEEYEYKEENEMIDVYSMGNIFYTIIVGEMPFEGQKESKAQKKVKEGRRPRIPEEVLESEDPAINVLVNATKRCWEQEPGDRPSAAQIRDELKKVMEEIKAKKATKEMS